MLKIANGEIYDPLNGVAGETRDIWVENGKVVPAPLSPGRPVEVIDAAGMLVMPGGVDIHSHIAGSKVNAGRVMRPEVHRREEGKCLFTARETGYLYTRMGYTTVMEAAVAPLKARHTHEELNYIPWLDKGCYTLMGNNHLVLDCVRRKDRRALQNLVAWLLSASRGMAVKVVNAGGVENWKQGGNVRGLADPVAGWGVTPEEIIAMLVEANETLALPHGVHLHCHNLGLPGNYRTVLETLRAVQGGRVHLTHLQFYSYGGEGKKDFCSRAGEVAAAVNEQPRVTVDVGQVIFGDVTTMTADAPAQYGLYRLTGNRWINADVEMESGAGIVPLAFRPQSPVNAVQWAAGLELFLLITDPWRVFLTTDHPNAGPFTMYPRVIKLLMDRGYREEVMRSLHPEACGRTALAEIRREYTLAEIAVITRAGPARALGLRHKGHLGVGADADIAIYRQGDDWEQVFSRAAYVFKSGELVVRDGEVVREPRGKTFRAAAPWEPGSEKEFRDRYERWGTISFDNYGVEDAYLPREEVIR
ncbi:hypothetical protein SY88_20995 [Clostridiales bacterium PH28_bin88]|nr:hypothetical protein SY88_20995 [Clostridiales bacterium PH28_bin88]